MVAPGGRGPRPPASAAEAEDAPLSPAAAAAALRQYSAFKARLQADLAQAEALRASLLEQAQQYADLECNLALLQQVGARRRGAGWPVRPPLQPSPCLTMPTSLRRRRRSAWVS